MKAKGSVAARQTAIVRVAVGTVVLATGLLAFWEPITGFVTATLNLVHGPGSAPLAVPAPNDLQPGPVATALPSGNGTSPQERLLGTVVGTLPPDMNRLLPPLPFSDLTQNQSGVWQPLDTHESITQEALALAGTLDVPTIKASYAYRVVSIIPGDETAFRNVFGTAMSAAAAHEMQTYAQLFLGLQNATILNSPAQGRGAMTDLLNHGPEGETIIIVGHSEAAEAERKLRLPNGEDVGTAEFQSACLRARKNCLFITCYSDDLQLNGSINLQDAFQMVQVGVNQLAALERSDPSIPTAVYRALQAGTMTPAQLIIDTIRHERVRRQATRLTLIGTSVVAGVGVYLEVSQYNLSQTPGTAKP